MNSSNFFLNLNSQVEAEKILWIQGPGGNSSVKQGSRLLVKASGTRLRDIQSMDQLAKINIDGLRTSLAEMETSSHADREESYKRAIEKSTLANSPRASMESGFHAWLPQQYVFHIHSLAGIGLAEVAAQSATKASFLSWYQQSWEQELGKFQVIDSCLPGYQLTSLIAESPPAAIYFLRNHGVIIAFDDVETLKRYKVFEMEGLKKFLPLAEEKIQKWKQQEALALVKKQEMLLEASLQFYFPDMAMMLSRIQKSLVPTQLNVFRFVVDAQSVLSSSVDHQSASVIDLDALENWLANSMLQKLFPNLPILSQQVCDQILHLPTEIARKKVMEQKS